MVKISSILSRRYMVAISQNNEVLIIVQSGMENSLWVIFVTTGIKFYNFTLYIQV